MFNPAYPFDADVVRGFMAKQTLYFVKSSYPRGCTEEIKNAYLITHYHDRVQAIRHYDAIDFDADRTFYDLTRQEDVERFKSEANPPKGIQSFSKLILPQQEDIANKLFKPHITRYLKDHTNWSLRNVKIVARLHFKLGELMVRIPYYGQSNIKIDEIEVKFEDIERS